MPATVGVRAPTATDDATQGYSVGSTWLNLSNGKVYTATSVASDAAVWTETVDIFGIRDMILTHAAAVNPHGTTAASVGAIPTAEKAAALGVATLDALSKVPTAQLGGAGADVTKFLRGDQSWAAPSGGTPPTGTGFRHVTAGAEDAAAKLVVNADVGSGAAIAESKLGLNFATHSSANDPASGEKAALAGTSGTPGSGNRFVTDADVRNSNARTPVAHGASLHDGTVEATVNKGAASGYAGLGANSLVPMAQLGSSTPDATKFLRGDQTWAVPATGGVLNNLAAAAGPLASSDSTAGYAVGSLWIDLVNDTGWICVDATAGAAIWKRLTPDGVPAQREMQVLVNAGAATITTLGLAVAPTLTATVSSVTEADGSYASHATTAISGNPSGVISAFTVLRRDWQPRFATLLRTVTPITLVRFWVGLFSASPDASAVPAIHLAAFRYDTGVDGTAFWRCCTDNASGAPTVTATAVPVTVSTRYAMRIECFNSPAEVRFYLNEVLVALHTTKLPTASTLLGYGNRVTTLSAAIRNLEWSTIYLAH